jgi:hypothetical protein
MRMMAAPTACLVFAILVGEARQEPSQSLQTSRTGVDIVQVDVSVLDRDRRLVRGLIATDFTILEDGKERPVVAFTAVDLASAATPATSWMRDVGLDVASNVTPQEGRLVVILMDRTIRPPHQITGRRIAEAAIKALGPGDLGAVIHSGPGAPQNFTSDRSPAARRDQSSVRRPPGERHGQSRRVWKCRSSRRQGCGFRASCWGVRLLLWRRRKML